MVLTSTPNKSAILFCDIQNVSLLKMTSTRASPWAVLYNNILELSELCINSAIETSNNKNRKFTSMNMFPTTLAVLGVDIDSDRLGLGTNLYADKKTLAEKYGYEYIEQELSKNSKFYNKDILGE